MQIKKLAVGALVAAAVAIAAPAITTADAQERFIACAHGCPSTPIDPDQP